MIRIAVLCLQLLLRFTENTTRILFDKQRSKRSKEIDCEPLFLQISTKKLHQVGKIEFKGGSLE